MRILGKFGVVLAVALLGACGGSDTDSDAKPSETTAAESSGKTIRVPEDFKTITEAVESAAAGDMVLIGPGTYKETAVVETENLVIRGTDRNKVIIDGEFERENGIMVLSDGVAVENLTVRNNTKNGVYFTGDYDAEYLLSGYRVSYVTAYNNGLYGVYAFNAKDGLIEKSYGSGHPDSAFYVGQCEDCNVIITDVVAEDNMLGYSGTNSTGWSSSIRCGETTGRASFQTRSTRRSCTRTGAQRSSATRCWTTTPIRRRTTRVSKRRSEMASCWAVSPTTWSSATWWTGR
jgi:hypothetical protein